MKAHKEPKPDHIFTICLLLVVIYLAGWFAMPLYPDEVAGRLYMARFLADGPIEYSLTGLCPSGTHPMSWLFLPASWTFAMIDRVSGWALVRWLPFLSICALALSLAALFRQQRWNPWAMRIFCSGFIGVAGYGLLLSRPEYLLVLQAAICIATYHYARSPTPCARISALLILANAVIIDFSLYGHMQGIFLLPLNLLIAGRLLCRHKLPYPRIVAAIAIIACIALSAASFQKYAMICKEDPEFQTAFANFNTSFYLMHGGSLSDLLPVRLEKYFNAFLFNQRFQIDVLPPISDAHYLRFAPFLNALITALVFCNLAAMILILLVAGIRTGRKLFSTNLLALAGSDAALLAYGALAWLLIFFNDAVGNFYRNCPLNLLAATLFSLAAAAIIRPALRRGILIYGGIGCIACAISIAQNAAYIQRGLSTYSGPSIPLNTDWKQLSTQARTLAKTCGISPDLPDLVIDDLTYNAFQTHHHLIPVHYLWYRYALVGRHNQSSGTPESRLASLKSMSNAMIAGCGSFEEFGIPYQFKNGGMCCTRFHEK